MILVTVGSSRWPFERLMGALQQLPADELFVQHGRAEPPAGVARAVPFLSFQELADQIAVADHVICHAGVGTIICALRAGHTPIVVPRQARFSESIDDHQLELAEALAERERIVLVRDLAELREKVARAPERRPALTTEERPIHAAVRAALSGQPLAA